MWRNKAIEIRVQFERNRHVRDPRAVARLLNEAEKEVQRMAHPDPYKREFLEPGKVQRRDQAGCVLAFVVVQHELAWIRGGMP